MKNSLFFLAVPSLAAAAGCYKTPGSDALVLPTSNFLTQSSCQSLCASHGLPVAATNNGAECACSRQLPDAGQKTADEQCDVACPGYPSQTCKPSRVLPSIRSPIQCTI